MFPQKKYQTAKGIVNKDSEYGMCVVQNDAARLNRIIVVPCWIRVKAMSFRHRLFVWQKILNTGILFRGLEELIERWQSFLCLMEMLGVDFK